MPFKSPGRRRLGLCLAAIAVVVTALGILRASRQAAERRAGKAPLMFSKAPARHQLAIAILAIATVAIGFGIFEGDLVVGAWVTEPGLARGTQLVKLLGKSSTIGASLR